MDNRKYVWVGVALTVVLLITVVGWMLYDRFSYGEEWANYDEMYQTERGAAVFLDDVQTPYHARYRNGRVYLPLDLLTAELDDRFYLSVEGAVLYTLPGGTVEVLPGQQSWVIDGQVTETPWPVCIEEQEKLYLVAELVRRLADVEINYYANPERVLILPGSRTETRSTVEKTAQVRVRAGRKSPILTEVRDGDEVFVLQELDDWKKVRTADGFVGYLPGSALGETVSEAVVSGFEVPDYAGAGADLKGPVRIVWHQTSTMEANQTFAEYIAPAQGLTVIAPTWFALSDTDGGITSLAESWYVEEAHARGLQVWGLVNDFKADLDKYEVLSRSSSRRTLIANLIAEAKRVGLDGINVDFEKIDSRTGVHFVQFIRELSVECRKEELVLSVDNYPLIGGRPWYDIAEQSVMADFVIMMGYDEHWGGGEPGSTASLPFTEETITMALELVPKEKLIHAIPFYTRVWGEQMGMQVSSTAVSMVAAKRQLEEHGVELRWLEREGQYFGEYISNGAKYSIWLEDVSSIELKLNLIEKYDLAGLACWKLGLEDEAVWPLIADCLE